MRLRLPKNALYQSDLGLFKLQYLKQLSHEADFFRVTRHY